jgi:hypothetical protein
VSQHQEVSGSMILNACELIAPYFSIEKTALLPKQLGQLLERQHQEGSTIAEAVGIVAM